MVSRETILEEGLTPDEVLDREVVEPQFEPEWPDFWDDHPEERPGENVRLEDGTLYWTYEGFDIELESYETTHWKAVVDIPKPYGKYYPRPVDLKCAKRPEYGYVDDVVFEDYETVQATIVVQANFQPTFEVNQFVDMMIETYEGGEEFEAEISEMLEAAREVEAEQKAERSPGWDEVEGEIVCPHCKESSTQVVNRDDGGADCLNCGENIDEWIDTGDDSE